MGREMTPEMIKVSKEMNAATNEMAWLTEGTALYAAAKQRHTEAKRKFIALMQERDAQENASKSPEVELTEIVDAIESRKNEMIKNAGVNTNSVIAGFCNGSLCVTTNEESKRICELRKAIMEDPKNSPEAARKRNLARMQAKREERKARNTQVSPSDKAKMLGCKSLAQVSRIAGVGKQTLINWHKNKPDLFVTVCVGVAKQQEI